MWAQLVARHAVGAEIHSKAVMGDSGTPTMSVRSIWPFRTVARELGFDSDAPWQAMGFSPEDMTNPETRVPVLPAQRAARFVVQSQRLWDYGVRAALAAEAGFLDLTEYAARCQPTVEGSLRCMARLVPLLIDAGHFDWSENVEGASLQWVSAPGAELDPASIEFVFAYLVVAGRRHTGDESFAPLRVQFRHPAPPDTEAHERHFRCPLEFSAPLDALVLGHEQLEMPLRQADSRLSALLDQVASHLLAQLRGTTAAFADEVRSLITKHLSNDGAPVTAIADELGVTPRTLHRRLAAESTTYRELADDVRKGLALAYVERRDLGMNEIAYLLGFSGVQAFHRAFKRWTAQTPGAYRKG